MAQGSYPEARIRGTLICDRSSRLSGRNSLLKPIFPAWCFGRPRHLAPHLSRMANQIGAQLRWSSNPNANLSGAIFEGLDYEAIYLLESSIFRHGDFGRLTFTANGTWLSRAELQVNTESKRVGIGGEVLPPGFNLTGSLPWNRANFSLYYDGPTDTWLQGFDICAVVHWVGQYEDDNVSLTESPKLNMPRTGGPGINAAPFPQRARKVADWTTLDLMASYTFKSAATRIGLGAWFRQGWR
jgi:uncharacterized protein YjbI with pentapeptide repeats